MQRNKQQYTVHSYHLPSQSTAALWSWRCPAPCPALAKVAITTISSGKPVPSPLANISVAIGIRVLSRTVHTPSPTWLIKKKKVSDSTSPTEIQLSSTLQGHWHSNALMANSHALITSCESWPQEAISNSQVICTSIEQKKWTAHKRNDKGCTSPVFPNNVSCQELQQLPVLLHNVQLIWIFGGGHGHPG